MNDIFQEALSLVKAGQTAALSTIVSSNGSLPMSRKAKMLVGPDGRIVGTVGGGCLEADVWAEAREVMESGRPSLQTFVLTEKHAGDSGLNCGGNVEIFTEPLDAERSSEVLQTLSEIRQARSAAALATLVAGEQDLEGRKMIVRADGSTVGSLGLPEAEAAVMAELNDEEVLPEDLLKVIHVDRQARPTTVFLESVCPEPTLYLFGGGHVSLAIAQIACTVGFRIVVIDDRQTFSNRDRFPMADETLTLEMGSAFQHLEIDDLSYIVAVTRGHQHDKTVVEQAVRTEAAYLGMIGSRRKIALMWKELEGMGIPRDKLEAIHAPIGLDIGSDTPEEIAVAVVAELIATRRSMGKPIHRVTSLSDA